jgi:teichuronic acid biosynthesis glycosyltransferase TuaG
MSLATVDIIVPVFNPGPEFHRTMSALLMQTYPHIQIILIDDGSVSGLDLIESFVSETCVKYVRLAENQGGGHARNAGLEVADATFVAFCDSDDVWQTEKIEKQLAFMMDNGVSMSHCDVFVVGQEGQRRVINSSSTIDLWGFLRKTDLYCSTVCLNASLAKQHKFGLFRKRHPFAYWVSILEDGVKSIRCPDNAVEYVVRGGSVSSKRYSTALYTLLAYIWYPKNKILGIAALVVRCTVGLRGNSRILGRFGY